MLDTKDNYPNKYKDDHCPICDDGVTRDSQKHVMVCQIDPNQIVNNEIEYNDIFTNDIRKQLQISSIIAENFSKRKDKLRKIEEEKRKSKKRR